MKIAREKARLDEILQNRRRSGQRVAFVPTMGALHEGHMSLIKIASEKADCVVVSIFVNPAQFAPHEDYASYPRQEDEDVALLKAANVDLVYMPETDSLYPDGVHSALKAGPAARELESFFRPHFFDGVVTVVSKLFDHVEPNVAVFGEKDYQQLCVIREMVRTQGRAIEIVGAPIVRDAEGLALSSRNAYFTAEQLEQARQLNKVLSETADIFRHCEEAQPMRQSILETALLRCARNDEILNKAKNKILSAGFKEVQYLEVRDAETLAPLSDLSRPARLLVAAKLHGVRLIDNVAV